MGTVSPVRAQISSTKKLGIAWVQLCLALAAHVTDEALTGFLSVYNPTVLALQAKLGFWLMPTFEFREWLTGLIVAVLLLLALSPLCVSRSAVDPAVILFSLNAYVRQRTGTHHGNPSGAHGEFGPFPATPAGILFIAFFANCLCLCAGAAAPNAA